MAHFPFFFFLFLLFLLFSFFLEFSRFIAPLESFPAYFHPRQYVLSEFFHVCEEGMIIHTHSSILVSRWMIGVRYPG